MRFEVKAGGFRWRHQQSPPIASAHQVHWSQCQDIVAYRRGIPHDCRNAGLRGSKKEPVKREQVKAKETFDEVKGQNGRGRHINHAANVNNKAVKKS